MSSPPRMLRSVDLPDPEAPTMAIISPGLTRRSRPWSATTSRSATLKILTRLSHTMSAPSPNRFRARTARASGAGTSTGAAQAAAFGGGASRGRSTISLSGSRVESRISIFLPLIPTPIEWRVPGPLGAGPRSQPDADRHDHQQDGREQREPTGIDRELGVAGRSGERREA